MKSKIKCNHALTRTVASGNTVHYARAICCTCGKFVSWKSRSSPISELVDVSLNERAAATQIGVRWDSYAKLWFAPTEEVARSLIKWRIQRK